MSRILQLLHIYAGLQSCVAMLLFGVAGLVATCEARPGAAAPTVVTRSVALKLDPTLGDQALAQRAWQALQLPMTHPPEAFALAHDAAGQLNFRLYTPNGETQVTVLPQRNQLLVRSQRAGLGRYLTAMHLQSYAAVRDSGSRVLKLWALYIEASIAALIFLVLSGLTLWLVLHRSERWGRAALVVGSGGFALLYLFLR